MATYDEIEFIINEKINHLQRAIDNHLDSARLREKQNEYVALKDVLDQEGFGGRENDTDADAASVVEERLAWLRDQRAEGLR